MTLTSALLENALDSAVACARSMPADDALQPGKRETREEREARNNRLFGARLVANSSVNLLTPVLLNACRKASEKRTLTDLESDLLDLARLAAPTPEDVAGYGSAFAGLEAEQSTALFPADTAGLGADSSYSYADAARDLPKYWDLASDLPNVIKTGASAETVILPAAHDVQRFGWSRPLLAETAEPLGPLPPIYGHKAVLTIYQATCIAQTEGENGDDEVYFVLHTAHAKAGKTSTSETMEHFKEGVTKEYHHEHEVAINLGTNPPPPKFGGALGIIEAWEEDNGKSQVLEEIRKKANEISEKLIEGVKDPTKTKGQLQAAAGIIMAIVDLFIQAWCDDFIAMDSFELGDLDFENRVRFGRKLVRTNDYGYEVLNWGKYEVAMSCQYVNRREM
ncbi:hypothetical protein ACH4TY_29200 [Streptomyces anulatus]